MSAPSRPAERALGFALIADELRRGSRLALAAGLLLLFVGAVTGLHDWARTATVAVVLGVVCLAAAAGVGAYGPDDPAALREVSERVVLRPAPWGTTVRITLAAAVLVAVWATGEGDMTTPGVGLAGLGAVSAVRLHLLTRWEARHERRLARAVWPRALALRYPFVTPERVVVGSASVGPERVAAAPAP